MTTANLPRFIARRLVASVVLMLGVSVVTFALTSLVPSNPLLAAIGEAGMTDPSAVKAYKQRFGLDKPVPVQYLVYVGNVVQGDLGTSRRTGTSVLNDLKKYAPASIELAIAAAIPTFLIAIAAGTLAALFRNRLPDQIIRVGSLFGVSMPIFWLALVAVYVFSVRLGWFAGSGRLDPGMDPPPQVTGLYTVDAGIAGDWTAFRSAFAHLLLPASVLALYSVSLLTRFTRSAVLDVLNNDFVRTARAKGLSDTVVARRHVLRAALVPIVTVAGLMFGVLLSGTVFVESIFAFPGLGQYAYLSATALDLPAIMGITLFIALVYITINFVVDLLYVVIDPRITLS
jgi:peptide/nickel transport system permease protein